MNRFLIIIILLVPASLFGQTYTTPVRVNLDKSMRADRAPMMKLDRSGNIYIAWISGADGNGNGPISIAVSTDRGMTFNNNLVCSDANCNANFQRTAQFVIDTKSTIHLVWMGSRVNMQPDIWYTRSGDQGKTWTKPIVIDDAGDSSKYAQDFPSIASDSSDNLYVSFLDSRMVQQKLAKTPLLYFSRSTDGGVTWSINTRADVPPGGIGGTCECCTESMASTVDGHIYIVYRSNINNLRDIWLARSYDKGKTFQPSLKIVTGDWNIDACPVTGPHIALDDTEGAHIVWRDARDDSSGMIHLYYAYVPKGSGETPANTRFDAEGAQQANYADIALYDHAKYKVIAYETYNFGMRYILSDNNTTLVANRPLQANGSSNKSFANVLFAAGGTRYLSWQDDMSDAGDIYFMKETSALSIAPGEVTLLSPPANATNVPEPITLTWQKNNQSNAYHVIVIFDDSENYPKVFDSTGITSTSITLLNLRGNGFSSRFTWHVAGINEAGEGPWSEARDFTIVSSASVGLTMRNSLSMYPNPVSKENPVIHIERISNLPATLKIIDLLGREVSNISIGSETSKVISLQNVPPGMYYCILGDGSAPKEIIIGQ